MVRAYYIDRIRVMLTALVIFHHSAITYGAPGGWYYRELPTTATLSGLLLPLFVSVNQAYFMGFFFLIAGYFTPGSYRRKGLVQFAIDRLIRLGFPLLVFAVVLDPLTNSIAEGWGNPAANAQPFLYRLLHRVVVADWNNGPLWFAEALLLFSAAYPLWHRWNTKELRRGEAPMPPRSAWIIGAISVGAGALLIRQWVPIGKTVFGLQLGYFSSYIFLFVVGTVASQRNWLDRLTWPRVRPWTIVSVLLLPLMMVVVIRSGGLVGNKFRNPGSLDIPGILYAFWEPFIAWGIIATYLVCFRKYGNQPSPKWESLSACAYAVYILHAPVLVAICMSLRSWHAPALAKFVVAGVLASLATLGLSSLLLRIPGFRRVV